MATLSSLGLSCPIGGAFYICQNNATEFIGCCTTDPCADGSGLCPKNNLRPASFSGDSYSSIPPQQCSQSNSTSTNTTALWFTCKMTIPPFLGCCTSNPCADGSCPTARLGVAKLSSDPDARAPFVTGEYEPVNPATPSPSSSAAPRVTPADQGQGLSTGAIAGIAVGSAVVVIAVVAFMMYKCGWHARKKKEREAFRNAGGIPGAGIGYNGAESTGSPTLHQSPQSPAFGSPQQYYSGYKTADGFLSPPLSNSGSTQFSYHSRDGVYQPLSELGDPSLNHSELPATEKGQLNEYRHGNISPSPDQTPRPEMTQWNANTGLHIQQDSNGQTPHRPAG
ncbi:hypothetical protein B0T25DRAFT_553040 [Lasiosphaeria hispida]|uniref:Uncharacterized protein n=1 Tax=Lasiosphaeria hispida TaxID=260671 RepID=A0AAJ0MB74_9PEZI|nr:hypothetical protein B0T25DRAFT_553040 [Lasiosphaeria hispida]